MPRIKVVETEYYPFFWLDEDPAPSSSLAFEIDKKTLTRWRRREKAFKEWQDEMEAAKETTFKTEEEK